MHVIPFRPDHLHALVLQEAQFAAMPMLSKHGYGEVLMQAGPCFTLADSDGRVYACAGLMDMWENRAHAWALLSHDAGRYFVRIVRAMRAYLELQDIRRIEAAVDAQFSQGHRLMHMLGFEREGHMRAFMPDGRDAVLYGRVR